VRILLTNDDGPDSLLLRTAIRCIRKYGELTVVIPSQEQSWMAKRMTRFQDIRKTTTEVEGQEIHLFGGSPADCANYGIYHLFDGKPDLVVSGINMGENQGLGMVLSSGTVGASVEANIAGVPGVSLSQQWREGWDASHEARLEKLVAEAFDFLEGQSDFPREPVTWNVNFPFEPAADCEVKRAIIGRTTYASFFEEKGGIFSFNSKLQWPAVEQRDCADGKLLNQGHITVIRLDVRTFGQDADW
jgi:5'-nucleotidase